jgi:hypothetical protein
MNLIVIFMLAYCAPKNPYMQWVPAGARFVNAYVPGSYGTLTRPLMLEQPAHYWVDPDASFSQLVTVRF